MSYPVFVLIPNVQWRPKPLQTWLHTCILLKFWKPFIPKFVHPYFLDSFGLFAQMQGSFNWKRGWHSTHAPCSQVTASLLHYPNCFWWPSVTFQFIKFDEPKWLGVMMIIPWLAHELDVHKASLVSVKLDLPLQVQTEKLTTYMVSVRSKFN